MRKRTLVMTIGMTSVAFAAFAHSGATGIVKERMDGMSEMGQAVKALTPMMRGQSEYQSDVVRASADVMIMHAGEQMSRLFPEGSGGKPSSAMPAVWDDWAEFTALAEQLKINATGMKLGADNGITSTQDSESASLMGGDASAMGGGVADAEAPMTSEMLASLPTDTAFAAVVQTCSVCHQKFRAEEN